MPHPTPPHPTPPHPTPPTPPHPTPPHPTPTPTPPQPHPTPPHPTYLDVSYTCARNNKHVNASTVVKKKSHHKHTGIHWPSTSISSRLPFQAFWVLQGLHQSLTSSRFVVCWSQPTPKLLHHVATTQKCNLCTVLRFLWEIAPSKTLCFGASKSRSPKSGGWHL